MNYLVTRKEVILSVTMSNKEANLLSYERSTQQLEQAVEDYDPFSVDDVLMIAACAINHADQLRSCYNWLRFEPVWRVQLDRPWGQCGTIIYVEATDEAEATDGFSPHQTVVNARHATTTDVQEVMELQ